MKDNCKLEQCEIIELFLNPAWGLANFQKENKIIYCPFLNYYGKII